MPSFENVLYVLVGSNQALLAQEATSTVQRNLPSKRKFLLDPNSLPPWPCQQVGEIKKMLSIQWLSANPHIL